MFGLFNENNFLSVALLRIWEIVLSNLLFVFCCVPIITIGPSFTALYHCTLRMVKGNNPGTFKTFFRAFKQNFKQSIIIWIFTLLIAFILYTNITFLRTQSNTASHIFMSLMLIFLLFLCIFSLYIYPVIAAFEGTIRMHARNSFIFAMKHLLKTILMLVIGGLPLLMTFVDVQLQPLYVFCWFFFGFSTVAYINSKMLYKMFKPYLPEDPAEAEIDKYFEDGQAYLP